LPLDYNWLRFIVPEFLLQQNTDGTQRGVALQDGIKSQKPSSGQDVNLRASTTNMKS